MDTLRAVADIPRGNPAEAPQNATAAFLAALAALPVDDAAEIAERAAILETEGGLSRQEAERVALGSRAPALEMLDYFRRRFPLAMQTEDGATITKWGDPGNMIRTRAELESAMQGEGDARGAGRGQVVSRFAFVPASGGYIVLDLDRGHADGADGVAEIQRLLAGKPLVDTFRNLDAFPAYTRTPKGGYHLFFRYAGSRQYGPQSIAPGVEVAHVRHLITAAGSERGGTRYTFHGNLDAAPPFPPALEAMLKPIAEYRPAPTPKPYFPKPGTHERMSLDRIAQYALDDGDHGGSRNRLCFEVARRARSKSYGAEEVKAFLRIFPNIAGLPDREIDSAVNSAFKGGL